MSLQPLFETTWVIQVHAFTAMAAVFLGLVQLIAPKGTLPHKTLGAVWVLIMAVVAVSSIFIRPSLYPGLPVIEWFGFIHIFTVVTIVSVIQGSYFLMKGGPLLKSHSYSFIGLFVGSLIAGALAFLPGRIMNQVVFGG